MSSFFNEAIFDSSSEKRTLNFKVATCAQLAKFVEFVNVANEIRVAAEAQSRPELLGYKPAKLDESTVVEKILEKVLSGDKAFQHFLATGDVALERLSPATNSTKKSKREATVEQNNF